MKKKKAHFTTGSGKKTMENPYHAGKRLHGKLRRMDGRTYREPHRPYAIRMRTHRLPQTGRNIQTCQGNTVTLQKRVQKRIRHG